MKKIIFIYLLLLCLLISCSSLDKPEKKTGFIIGAGEDVNKSIQVSAPEGWNTYKIDDPINLAVFLQSKYPVYVSDRDVTVGYLEGKAWHPVLKIEWDTYFEDVIYYEDVEVRRMAPLVVQIDLSSGEYVNGGMFRFFVTGYIFKDQMKGEKVFAYVDVELFP